MRKSSCPVITWSFRCVRHLRRLKGAPVPEADSVRVELLIVPTGYGFALGRDEVSAVWKQHFLTWLDALP